MAVVMTMDDTTSLQLPQYGPLRIGLATTHTTVDNTDTLGRVSDITRHVGYSLGFSTARILQAPVKIGGLCFSILLRCDLLSLLPNPGHTL